MTEEENKARAKKWYKRAALVGAVLGLICHSLPPEYRAACELIANVCTFGGL